MSKVFSLAAGLLIAASIFPQTSTAAHPTVSVLHGNRVEIREYAPRVARGQAETIELLQQPLNADSVVRYDASALLAVLSQHAYVDDKATIDRLMPELGFEKWIAIHRGTMVGHVMRGPDVAVVLFRGTNFNEIGDWLYNLDTRFIDSKQGRFHRGFHEAYCRLRPTVKQFLNELQVKHLWVTGHSLGGAMAVNCAVDLTHCDGETPNVVTFGQPRVTDARGARWLDENLAGRYLRFVNGVDIVPSVPPTRWRRPYSHAGRFVQISESDVVISESIPLQVCYAVGMPGPYGVSIGFERAELYQPSNEPPPLTESEFQALRRNLRRPNNICLPPPCGTVCQAATAFGLVTRITDHYMANYLALIRLYRDREPTMLFAKPDVVTETPR